MKKVLVTIFICLVLVSVFLVSAVEMDNEVSVSVNEGWNLIWGLYDPSQFVESDVELIYGFDAINQKYILLYAKRGTLESGEYINIDLPVGFSNILPTSSVWVYSGRIMKMKYNVGEAPVMSQRQLYSGWNFVPITSEAKGYSINQLKGECSITSVYAFVEEDGISQWINLYDGLDDERMLGEGSAQGQQLVVNVVSDCKLADLVSGEKGVISPYLEGSCSDSDGGNEKYIVGETCSGAECITDYCGTGALSNRLYEFVCDPNIDDVETFCLNGCVNGACIKEDSCSDSDGGNEKYIVGETCSGAECITDYCGTGALSNRLYEFVCDPNIDDVETFCPNGCVDGACIR